MENNLADLFKNQKLKLATIRSVDSDAYQFFLTDRKIAEITGRHLLAHKSDPRNLKRLMITQALSGLVDEKLRIQKTIEALEDEL